MSFMVYPNLPIHFPVQTLKRILVIGFIEFISWYLINFLGKINLFSLISIFLFTYVSFSGYDA